MLTAQLDVDGRLDYIADRLFREPKHYDVPAMFSELADRIAHGPVFGELDTSLLINGKTWHRDADTTEFHCGDEREDGTMLAASAVIRYVAARGLSLDPWLDDAPSEDDDDVALRTASRLYVEAVGR